MATLSETFVTKAYDKKGRKVADKKPKPKSRQSKQYTDANLTAKPVKPSWKGTAADVAKAGGMQRREMARTRLKQQEGRLTAAQRRVVVQREKDAAAKKREKATRRAFLRSI